MGCATVKREVRMRLRMGVAWKSPSHVTLGDSCFTVPHITGTERSSVEVGEKKSLSDLAVASENFCFGRTNSPKILIPTMIAISAISGRGIAFYFLNNGMRSHCPWRQKNFRPPSSSCVNSDPLVQGLVGRPLPRSQVTFISSYLPC